MAWKNVCPKPECNGRRFKNLENLKTHMEEMHGGYTASEIDASGGEDHEPSNPFDDFAREERESNDNPTIDTSAPARAAAEPKKRERNTRANVDLNKKMNDTLRLQIRKLLGHPLTPEEAKRLQADGDEVCNAMMGFQFNFEEKVVSLNHWIFKVLILIVLTVAPFIPDLPTMLAKIEEQKRMAALKNANKTPEKKPTPIRREEPQAAPEPVLVPAPANANAEGQPATRDEAADGLMVQP